MPIYEYRCDNGHTFETLQRMTDEPLTVCETCEAPAHRVLHAPAVHFKGSGFYNTDYGTKRRARELRNAGEGKSSGGESGRTGSSGSDGGAPRASDGGSSASTSTAAATSD